MLGYRPVYCIQECSRGGSSDSIIGIHGEANRATISSVLVGETYVERVGQEKQQDVLGAKVDPQCLVLSTSLRLLSEAYHVAQRALHL